MFTILYNKQCIDQTDEEYGLTFYCAFSKFTLKLYLTEDIFNIIANSKNFFMMVFNSASFRFILLLDTFACTDIYAGTIQEMGKMSLYLCIVIFY